MKCTERAHCQPQLQAPVLRLLCTLLDNSAGQFELAAVKLLPHCVESQVEQSRVIALLHLPLTLQLRQLVLHKLHDAALQPMPISLPSLTALSSASCSSMGKLQKIHVPTQSLL